MSEGGNKIQKLRYKGLSINAYHSNCWFILKSLLYFNQTNYFALPFKVIENIMEKCQYLLKSIQIFLISIIKEKIFHNLKLYNTSKKIHASQAIKSYIHFHKGLP